MRSQAALREALDLIHVPSRVRHMRASPLPDGVDLLLRIAAGDEVAEVQAAGIVDRPVGEIREAAAFFIEQVLLAPEADSYRVLGASPDASRTELRQNMALLMRWLHPDRDAEASRALFAGRVTGAWDDLKTSDRRRAYDQRVRQSETHVPRRNGRTSTPPAKRAMRRRRGKSVQNGREMQVIDSYGEDAGLLRRALWRLLGRPKP